MKARVQNLNRGFSLLELLVYVSILAVVLVVLSGIFLSISRSSGQSEAQQEVNSNVRFIFNKLGQDIRLASAVSDPVTAGGTGNALSLTVNGKAVNYCVISGRLLRQTGSACDSSSEAVSSEKVSISNLLFSRIENTNPTLGKTIVSIKIDIDVKYNSSSPDWQYSTNKSTSFSLQ